MNPNAVTLEPTTKPSGVGLAEYDMLSHKVEINSQNQLRVINTNTTPLQEYVHDLTGEGLAIGLVAGHFCVGNITFHGPKNDHQFQLDPESKNIFFHHHTLSNVFGANIDGAPAYDLELVGADDVRYQYFEANIIAPRLHRFLLSKCFVHLRVFEVNGEDFLKLTFQANAFNSGYIFEVQV